MTLDALVSRGVLERNRTLAPLTTYKFGGPAAYFAEVTSERDLIEVLVARRDDPSDPAMLVLGRGSNVVISDSGLEGLVIRLAGEFTTIEMASDYRVNVGGAVALPKLARTLARAGRSGLEFFVAVPGSVGGAVRMNAGCHGSDTAEWLLDVRVVDATTCEATRYGADALGLDYRKSNLGNDQIVVEAGFRTVDRPAGEIEGRMREITRWRREHQPGGTLNAGSVFKNPQTAAAGKIIDDLGLKGLAVGGASVSQRHGNFFVANDSATAQDVYDLVHEVRRRVEVATGIWLEPEIQFAGSFVSHVGGGELHEPRDG